MDPEPANWTFIEKTFDLEWKWQIIFEKYIQLLNIFVVIKGDTILIIPCEEDHFWTFGKETGNADICFRWFNDVYAILEITLSAT